MQVFISNPHGQESINARADAYAAQSQAGRDKVDEAREAGRAEAQAAMVANYQTARETLVKTTGAFGKELDRKARKLALKMAGIELPEWATIGWATPDDWGSGGYRDSPLTAHSDAALQIDGNHRIILDGETVGLCLVQRASGTVIFTPENRALGRTYREHKMPHFRYSTAHDAPASGAAGRVQLEADLRALLARLRAATPSR